jgi:Tol biopolymer transport system component
MKHVKIFALLLFAALLALPMAMTGTVEGQSATEAPTGFDNQTNGFTNQTTFDADKRAFQERDEILPDANQGGGLGPVYNAQACAECHQNPVTGGISQITEMRAGHLDSAGHFVDAPGGSLIHTRAIDPQIQERVPDGPRIVFGANAQIAVIGSDGGQYGFVGTNNPGAKTWPVFSPDGKKIAFQSAVTAFYDIYVMDNDGSNLRQLTTNPAHDKEATWSPDGTKIAFVSLRDGNWEIYVMNADGSNQHNITNDPNSEDIQPAWSRDGSTIAFTKVSHLTWHMMIWKMNPDGSGQTQLTNSPGDYEVPSWSPDSNMIAFSSNRDGNYEIYKMLSSGANQVRLTNNPAADQYPAWSPDGTTIAFSSDRPGGGQSGVFRIHVMQTDGSNQTRISEISDPNGYRTVPSWSPDNGETIRTFRTSLNTLGDGFVEAIDDATLMAIAANQPNQDPLIHGQFISVSSFETSTTRIGRFGWKDQIASLLTFSSDAYLNEQGITNRFLQQENTSLGRSVAAFDHVADPEDNPDKPAGMQDIDAFARFMRSTKAPARDRVLVPNDDEDPGSQLFDQIGCSICHVRTITTGTAPIVIFAGENVNPSALANKIIHPFGDFLLHDIGTGDGIVQNGGETTRNKVRTAPLWGVRTRDRLMHDGGGSSSQPTNHGDASLTFNEAILRHAGEATGVRLRYQALLDIQKRQLIKFLKSL